MGKNAVFLFCIMAATVGKLSLASCTPEYLTDIKTLEAAVKKCPKDCNATLVEQKCCLGMNVSSAEACKKTYIIDGLKSLKEHLGGNSNGIKCTRRLKRKFMSLTKKGTFDLTCKTLISSKDFLDLLKNVFQQLCNTRSQLPVV